MFRNLNAYDNKNYPTYIAAEDMTRGAFIKINAAAGTVSKATGLTDKMVNVAANYDGINSMIAPTDGAFEDIKAGDRVIVVTAIPGEKYATSEVTPGAMAVGAAMTVTAGKAVSAGTTAGNYNWVYGGTYDDPTGITMYAVCRESATV